MVARFMEAGAASIFHYLRAAERSEKDGVARRPGTAKQAVFRCIAAPFLWSAALS